jgi:hypothetical protein
MIFLVSFVSSVVTRSTTRQSRMFTPLRRG